jgi:hypothetical protein
MSTFRRNLHTPDFKTGIWRSEFSLKRRKNVHRNTERHILLNCNFDSQSCEKFESLMVSVRRVWRHRHSRNNKEAVLFLKRLITTTWTQLFFSIQQPTCCRDDAGRDVKGSHSCVWITSDGVIRHRSRVHVWTWGLPAWRTELIYELNIH